MDQRYKTFEEIIADKDKIEYCIIDHNFVNVKYKDGGYSGDIELLEMVQKHLAANGIDIDFA